MRFLQKKSGFKKTVLSLLIFSLLLPSAFLAFPQKTEADGLPVFDFVVWIQEKLGSIPDNLTAGFQSTESFYRLIIDPLAVKIARLILKRMTASIVQWINTGFQGSPSFLTNSDKFFRDSAQEATNIFIIEYVASTTENPYAIDIANSILNPRKGVYSLYDDIAYNCVRRGGGDTCPPQLGSPYVREAYARQFVEGRFGNGGWAAWYSLTQNSENNIFGAYIDAQQELQRKIANKNQNYRDNLNRSGGYLDQTRCLEYYVEDAAGNPLEKNDANCKTKETVTPGKLAGEYLAKASLGPLSNAELVKDFATSIDLIVEAFLNQVIFQGVKGLSDVAAGVVSGEARAFGKTQGLLSPGTLPSIPAVDPVARALTEIGDSINTENKYLAVKNKSLGAVLIYKEKVRALNACYDRLISKNQSLKTDEMIVSGQAFASTTLNIDITPRETALNTDIASSTSALTMLKDIKQRTATTTNDILVLSILQNYATQRSNGTFHTEVDVIRADTIEFADIKTLFDGKMNEVTPRLDACLAREKGN